MPTNREIVSKVKSELRLTSSDILITDRLVLSIVQAINIKLVIQQLQRRIGVNSPNLFTDIPCLKMTPVPLYTCCDTTSDCMVASSQMKLPALVEGYYGNVVRGVFSIDSKVKFTELPNPNNYVNLSKIYPKSKKVYYWIQNGYLYISDPNIEVVKISAFFADIEDVCKFLECVECVDPKDFTYCPTNPLDLDFKSLPKLEDDIVRLAAAEVMDTFKRLRPEITSDNQEGN